MPRRRSGWWGRAAGPAVFQRPDRRSLVRHYSQGHSAAKRHDIVCQRAFQEGRRGHPGLRYLEGESEPERRESGKETAVALFYELIYFSTDINRLYNLVFVGQDIVLQRFAVWDRSIEGSDEPDCGFGIPFRPPRLRSTLQLSHGAAPWSTSTRRPVFSTDLSMVSISRGASVLSRLRRQRERCFGRRYPTCLRSYGPGRQGALSPQRPRQIP